MAVGFNLDASAVNFRQFFSPLGKKCTVPKFFWSRLLRADQSVLDKRPFGFHWFLWFVCLCDGVCLCLCIEMEWCRLVGPS